MMARVTTRIDRAAPGYDFGGEFRATASLGIGDALVLEQRGEVAAAALWHSAALAEGRRPEELRVLKLFADGDESLERLLGSLEHCAAAARLRRVAIRCQSAYPAAFRALVARGYRVRWTDLRMTLEGYPETAVPQGEVLLSNWEI